MLDHTNFKVVNPESRYNVAKILMFYKAINKHVCVWSFMIICTLMNPVHVVIISQVSLGKCTRVDPYLHSFMPSAI